MQESLTLVQGLYEKGYLTYPRTNSEYLATAEKDKMRTIIGNKLLAELFAIAVPALGMDKEDVSVIRHLLPGSLDAGILPCSLSRSAHSQRRKGRHHQKKSLLHSLIYR